MTMETLRFLDASPEAMADPELTVSFLRPFLSCLLSDDQSVRHLSLSVAKRLFSLHRDSFRALKMEDTAGLRSLCRDVWTER